MNLKTITETYKHILQKTGQIRDSESVIHIITTTFQMLLTIFLVTLLIHEFKPLWVEHYISLNNFLIVIIILGILAVLVEPEEPQPAKEAESITRKDYIVISLSGIIGSIIVWYKIKDIGWVAYLIAAMSGVLIITLSILMIEESGNDYADSDEDDEDCDHNYNSTSNYNCIQ